MNFDFQITRLSNKFYETYTNPPFSEILEKRKRAYTCLVIETSYGYYICIPFRSEMRHKNGFHFKGTKRSATRQSGLDYSKIVIITNDDFLEAKNAIIDNDEYVKTIDHIDQIASEAYSYISIYIDHQTGKRVLVEAEFKRKYGMSTLQYFHKELGL